jgi:DNA relaxase NicK
LAVDVRFDVARVDLAKDAATSLAHGVHRGSKIWYPVLIQNLAGGQTFYIGARERTYFLRLYDKGAQTGEFSPGKLWRYEAQVGQAAADVVAKSLAANLPNRASWIQSYVYDKFCGFSVAVAFRKGDNIGSVIAPAATVYSSEKTLAWLRSSVKPAVARLIDEGLEPVVLEALGLPRQLELL